MRRTKEDKKYNNEQLEILYKKYCSNKYDECIVSELDLKGIKYIGSLPYTTPTVYDDYWIKQLPKTKGDRWNLYFIFKVGRASEVNVDEAQAKPGRTIVMPLADGQFEKIFIDLVESNYLLGKAEYNRNPSYNNQHFHNKAEVGLLNYLEEHNPELWAKIQDRLSQRET